MLLDDIITCRIASGIFGPQGADIGRTGYNVKRDLGLGWILYGFVRAMKPKRILEIGSGGSTCCLAFGCAHNISGEVFSVDPSEDVQQQTKDALDAWNITDRVHFIRGKSEDITWTDSIDMLFVDGDHGYDTAKIDWEKFMPFLVRGGYAFYHDYMVSGVGKLINDKMDGNEQYSMLAEPDNFGLAIIQHRYRVDLDRLKVAAKLGEDPNSHVNVTNMRQASVMDTWRGRYIER